MEIAYLISDSVTPQIWSVAHQQMVHLAESGAQITVYFLHAEGVRLSVSEFPVFQFAHTEQEAMARMLCRDRAVKVATDARTANLAADRCPDSSAYMILDSELRRSTTKKQARAVAGSYARGLLMLSTAAWIADDVEESAGVRPQVIGRGIDHAVFNPRPSIEFDADVFYINTGGPAELLFREAMRLAKASQPEISLLFTGEHLGPTGVTRRSRTEIADDEGATCTFARCRTFVHTSTPLVSSTPLLEAMACGAACVVLDGPGISEHCQHEHNVLVVSEPSPEGLALAINRLLDDEALAGKLRANAQASVRDLSWNTHTAQIRTALRPLVSGRVTPADARREPIGVSVVIPVRNAGSEFRFLLEKLRAAGLRFDLEVVVIDSGSDDGTPELAEKSGATVKRIKPSQFNHGKTRNMGADLASKEYLLFLTQDAIPLGDDWLDSMIRPMVDDERIAAVRGREVPRSDADLFCVWMNWNYHGNYAWHADTLIDLKHVDIHSLPGNTKRSVAQLADTCTAVRRDLFDKMRFHETNFGEDLDLGIRLLGAGYKLQFLFTAGVIHSHNRDAEYILRRFYVDAKLAPGILGISPSAPLHSADSIGTTVRRMCAALARVNEHLTKSASSRNTPHSMLLDELASCADAVCAGIDTPWHALNALPTSPRRPTIVSLVHEFSRDVDAFFDHFERVYGTHHGMEAELTVCLTKILAGSIGRHVGTMVAANQGRLDSKLVTLDRSLAAGV